MAFSYRHLYIGPSHNLKCRTTHTNSLEDILLTAPINVDKKHFLAISYTKEII